MNFELFSIQHFLIFTIRSALVLQVLGDDRAAHETWDGSIAFPQKNHFSADTNWRGKNIMTETKQKIILINRTLGDCVQLDLENRKSNIYIHDVTWKKGQILTGKMKNQNVSSCTNSKKRCHVFNNGSLSFCPTLLEDIGHYTAEVYNKDGENLYSQTIQLVLTQPNPELEPEPKRRTNDSYLFFFILEGVYVAVFLIVLVSFIYHFGKRKNQPVHWETGRNTVEYATVYKHQQDWTCYKDNGSPVLHRPQTVETTEGGEMSLIRNQEETTAAAGSHTECPVSLNISTFQGKQKSLP